MLVPGLQLSTASGPVGAAVPRSAWSAGGVGAATTVAAVLPKSLVAAMVVQIGAELGFGTSGLGLAVAVYWATNATASVPVGRLADRLGATRSLRGAALLASGAALGIAVVAQRWWHLVAFLALAGAAHALGHPGANRLLVNSVAPTRLGLAFGFKGAAAPAASAVAGISVPLLALTVGWRWAFGLSAALALPIVLAIGRRPAAKRPRQAHERQAVEPLRNRATVVMLAASFGLAVSASMTVQTFFVDAAVTAGVSAGVAGTVLAIASLLAMVSRLVTGIAADRMGGGHLQLCAKLQVVGAVGIVLLCLNRPVPVLIGAPIALAGIWGFNAVFWYALITAYRDSPGRITGAIQPGAAVGGILTPIAFGFIAESIGYQVAWAVSGMLALVAATSTALAAHSVVPQGRGSREETRRCAEERGEADNAQKDRGSGVPGD